MTDQAISVGDVLTISKKMSNLQPELLMYTWRNNGDDFMLRVEVESLRNYLDEVLKRTERPDPHKKGTPSGHNLKDEIAELRARSVTVPRIHSEMNWAYADGVRDCTTAIQAAGINVTIKE